MRTWYCIIATLHWGYNPASRVMNNTDLVGWSRKNFNQNTSKWSKPTQSFASKNDDVVNELQGVEDVDHVIMIVTKLARRLSLDKDTVKIDDYTPEPRVLEKGLSAVVAEPKDVWITLGSRRIRKNTWIGAKLRCARNSRHAWGQEVMFKHVRSWGVRRWLPNQPFARIMHQRSRLQPSVNRPRGCLNHRKGDVGNVVGRETDRTRYINTSGFQSPSFVPSLTTNDKGVTRSNIN